jgi:bacterioferritin (cytochrome b1)
MSFARLETSQSRLTIDWCSAGQVYDEQIVDAAGLIRSVTADDGRPLMILRRSTESGKKIQKMLTEALKSERFQLASKWFQSIELDDAVLEEDHPYHLLFAGKHPPALLLASPNGKKIVRFLGTRSQKVNWRDVSSVLMASYKGNPTKSVKGLERLLSKFDALDDRRKELNAQIARYQEKKDTAKVKSLNAKLAVHEKEREKVLAEEKKLRSLVLCSKKKADKTGG